MKLQRIQRRLQLICTKALFATGATLCGVHSELQEAGVGAQLEKGPRLTR